MTGTCSPSFNGVIHAGLEEILGTVHLAAIHPRANTPDAGNGWSTFHQALEEQLGGVAASGISLRAGRASFHHFLRKYGAESGLDSLEFRLRPPMDRLSAGLHILAGLIGRECAATVTVETYDNCWTWRMEDCPTCQHRQGAATPVCHFWVGLLQEYLAWAGGGRFFPVREVACCACGAPACEFRLQQKPLD